MERKLSRQWTRWLRVGLDKLKGIGPNPLAGGGALAALLSRAYPMGVATEMPLTHYQTLLLVAWWHHLHDRFTYSRDADPLTLDMLALVIDSTSGMLQHRMETGAPYAVDAHYEPLPPPNVLPVLLRQAATAQSETLRALLAYGTTELELDSVGIYPEGGSDVMFDAPAVTQFTLETAAAIYLHTHLMLAPAFVATPHIRVVYDTFVSDKRLYSVVTGGAHARTLAAVLRQPSPYHDKMLIAFVCMFAHTAAACDMVAGVRFLDTTLDDWMCHTVDVASGLHNQPWMYVAPQAESASPKVFAMAPVAHQRLFWYRVNVANLAAAVDDPRALPAWPPTGEDHRYAEKSAACGMALRQLLALLRPYLLNNASFATFCHRLDEYMAANDAIGPLDVFGIAADVAPDAFRLTAADAELAPSGIVLGTVRARGKRPRSDDLLEAEYRPKRGREAPRVLKRQRAGAVSERRDIEEEEEEEGEERERKRPRPLESCVLCRQRAVLVNWQTRQAFCSHLCAAIHSGALTHL